MKILLKRNRTVGRTLAIASLLSAGVTTNVFAQNAEKPATRPTETVLEEVLVTAANRTGKALDRIPGAVNLISTEDLVKNIAVTEDVTKLLEHSVPGYSPSREGRYTFGEIL